jgi:hypothetical protein
LTFNAAKRAYKQNEGSSNSGWREGAFLDGGKSGSELPEGIKRLGEDSGTDDKHLSSGRTRPTHTSTSQTSLELLNSAFGLSRANGIALFAKFLVLHAALMRMKVVGELRQASLAERTGNSGKIALK